MGGVANYDAVVGWANLVVRKADWPPLLAPGRHYCTLLELWDLGVSRFSGDAYAARERLYHSFEQIVQDILTARMLCQVRVDGSFITEKLEQNDIYVLRVLEFDLAEYLTEEQNNIIANINSSHDYKNIDSLAVIVYPFGVAPLWWTVAGQDGLIGPSRLLSYSIGER